MSNYIMDLRKFVGHQTIIQCAASIIVVNKNGQILLGKRTDNHKWGYSGGSIEIDEKVEDAAKRELYEEMGLVAEEIEFFMVHSGPEVHYTYPNGDEVCAGGFGTPRLFLGWERKAVPSSLPIFS